jgi:hypothetical protein
MLVFCELKRGVRDDFLSVAKAALEKELHEQCQPLHNCRVAPRGPTFYEWISSTQVKQILVICGHGTSDTQTLGGYSAVEVAQHLNRQGVSSAQISQIKLYSCSVGDTPNQDQNNFSQQLVIELNREQSALKGVSVFGPTGLIGINSVKDANGVLTSWTWFVRRKSGQDISLERGMIEYEYNAQNPGFVRGYIPPTL